MAPTDDDPSTLPKYVDGDPYTLPEYALPEWPLLCEVRVYVTAFCKSPEGAEDLILEGARKKLLGGYRYWQSADDGGRGIDPRFWGSAVPEHGVYYPIDWDTSAVAYLRLPLNSQYGLEAVVREKLEEEEFLPEPCYRIRLVRLHRFGVAAILRSAGFLPPPVMLPLKSTSEEPPKRWRKGGLKNWLVAHVKDIPHSPGEKMLPYAERLRKALCKDRTVKKLHATTAKSIATRLYNLGLGPRE
jgi:hypothetical protein